MAVGSGQNHKCKKKHFLVTALFEFLGFFLHFCNVFILKNVEKCHTYIMKQQIKIKRLFLLLCKVYTE